MHPKASRFFPPEDLPPMAVSAPSSSWRGLLVGLIVGAVIGGVAFMLGGGLLWLLALPLGAGAGAIAPAVKPPRWW